MPAWLKQARSSRLAKHRPARAQRALVVLTSALAYTSCLSLNDQFALPFSASTQTSTENTSTPTQSTDSGTNTVSGGQGEFTTDDEQTSSSVATTSDEPTSLSSETSSLTTSATDESSAASTGTGPRTCQNPTLCYEENAGRTINRLIAAPFDEFALRFPRSDEILNVARVDVYTGSVTTSRHAISLYADKEGNPGTKVRSEFFTASVTQRWYSATFDPPTEISMRAPHWIAWEPPGGSLGSSAVSGKQVAGKQKRLSSSAWENRGYPLMMRIYCCP